MAITLHVRGQERSMGFLSGGRASLKDVAPAIRNVAFTSHTILMLLRLTNVSSRGEMRTDLPPTLLDVLAHGLVPQKNITFAVFFVELHISSRISSSQRSAGHRFSVTQSIRSGASSGRAQRLRASTIPTWVSRRRC
jgi:hypothetical protein